MQKTSGIKIDSTCSFKAYEENLYKKTSPKVRELSTIMQYIELQEKRILSKAFFKFQFIY